MRRVLMRPFPAGHSCLLQKCSGAVVRGDGVGGRRAMHSNGSDGMEGRGPQQPLAVVESSGQATSKAALQQNLETVAFYETLVNPPQTIALEDATRTYATMDVVPPLPRFTSREDHSLPHVARTVGDASFIGKQGSSFNRWVEEEIDDGSKESDANNSGERAPHATGEDLGGPIAALHREGKLWTAFDGNGARNEPPVWFESLCRDLYFRTNMGAGELDEVAALSDPLRLAEEVAIDKAIRSGTYSAPKSESASSADPDGGVDPYLWLPFHLRDVADYTVGAFQFPSSSTYSHENRVRLCLGNIHREYVCFCESYAFPERTQLPTTVGTVPCRLLVDPASPAAIVFVQLSPDFPPSLWLPVKATAAAIRRVLAEFAVMATLHRDWHHEHFEERFKTAQRLLTVQRMPSTDGDALRYMGYDARNTHFIAAPIREFTNYQEHFLGEYDDPERLMEHVDLCPLLFAIPHMRTVTDLHAEHMIPTVAGPGVATSLYRCIYSKTLLLVQVNLSAEVKLPPQDMESFVFLWKDSQVVPKMRIPVFVRVIWPDNKRMCGGGPLVQRFNRLHGTEFALDTPIDAVLAIYYIMNWAGQLSSLLGVRGMRQRLAALESAACTPEAPKLYPSTRDIPNPEYTVHERLGMHVQYLAQLGDPLIDETIARLVPEASAPVRMGCAKAALISGNRELFRSIVSSEPPSRNQLYMTKLTRKRKTRDLVDPEPRLLDDQYEFAAPLWTKRGTRIDVNTLEGAVDAARLGV